jgi:hypothetical protein
LNQIAVSAACLSMRTSLTGLFRKEQVVSGTAQQNIDGRVVVNITAIQDAGGARQVRYASGIAAGKGFGEDQGAAASLS